MSSKASKLAASASFSHAAPAVSARRAATAAATKAPTEGASRTPSTKLPTHLVSQNPDNPREALGDVSDLAQTLIEVGLVNAISVVTVDAYLAERPDRAGELEDGAQYVVVDGHRRLAAAREAGLGEIKYSLDDAFAASDEKLLEAAYVANAHRENMTELEEAAALEKLVAFYGSQRKAAQRLGITQAFISQRLSLLQLDPTLQADLDAGKRKVEHVRGLSKLPPQQQRAKADERAAEATKKSAARKAASDNAVITPAPATASPPEPSTEQRTTATPPAPGDNAVITPGLASSPSSRPGEGTEGDNGVITPWEPEGMPTSWPWDDISAVAELICQKLPDEDVRSLAKALSAKVPAV